MKRQYDSTTCLRAYPLTGMIVMLCVVLCSFPAPCQELPVDCGVVTAPQIDEASGIAASHLNPGILWTHNDSGDMARVFAIDTSGALIAEYRLAGIDAFDCEDIAVGPGPEDGITYVYLADIGDNLAVRDDIKVYRLEEPRATTGAETSQVQVLNGVSVLTFHYPDGARDAETLMIDPQSGDILLITKREHNVRLYTAPSPHTDKLTNELTYLTDIPMTGVVGGDMNGDGHILVKTYLAVYKWGRETGESIEQTVQDVPQFLPYTPEHQGEAICWDIAGEGYYTLSERHGDETLHLYYYPLQK